MNDKNKKIAEKLHQKAIKLNDEGNTDEAIKLYKEALTYDPQRSTTYYNLGLIFKYKCEWELSYEFNLKALGIAPNDEASIWNFAIAATALKKWDDARNAWIKYGIKLKSSEGPVEEDFGITPIRLNPFTEGEVVWAKRICPARAKIESIPLPESGFRYADIVLHDGAPVGTRIYNDFEYSVFNVLSLFEISEFKTYIGEIVAPTKDSMLQLTNQLENNKIEFEDWTSSIRILCKQCSEGIPHKKHDKKLENNWQCKRQIGFAATNIECIENVLEMWKSKADGTEYKIELALK